MSGGKKRKEQKILHLMLSLLQIPTGPQREPQTMADLRLVLTPSQLLCKPQACQKGRRREQMREGETGRVEIIQSRQTLRYLSE